MLTNFIVGCIFPGLIVYFFVKRRATTNIGILCMVICGLLELLDLISLTFIAGCAMIFVIRNLSSDQIEALDRRIRGKTQSLVKPVLKEKKAVEEPVHINRGPVPGTQTPVYFSKECPGCGAPVNMDEHVEYCEYCGTAITLTSDERQSFEQARAFHKEKEAEKRKSENTTRSYSDSYKSAYSDINVQLHARQVAEAQAAAERFSPYSPKSRMCALLLCLFFGWVGAHRFYTKKTFTALLYLFTFGLLGFGVLVDFIMIATGCFEDKEGRRIKKW